jgi:hypothetical protein
VGLRRLDIQRLIARLHEKTESEDCLKKYSVPFGLLE